MKINLAVVKLNYTGPMDTVHSIGGAIYDPAIPVLELPQYNSQFFLGSDIDGNPIVCTTKTTNSPMSVVFTNSNGNYPAFIELAPPTVSVDFIGGRPDDRR